ncbi:MAG: HDOD domain-containing protein [Planctomycetales bacterium]|nr:HDOD domain-containing protein [Planctomycetales bacterium]
MSITALFVDDEPALLASIRRQLFSLKTGWKAKFTNSPREAANIIRAEKFDVVVSDMRMPEMDGAQLLKHVQECSPDTLRIILSGQSETEQLERVFGLAHLLLKKPCETKTIVNICNRCGLIRQRLVTSTTCSLITGRNQWVGASDSIAELLQILRDDDLSVTRVAQILKKDLVVTARVLGLVNSAFFGLTSPVADVERAIVLLGLKAIRAIYASIVASNFVSQSPLACRLATEGMEYGMRLAQTACESLKLRGANPDWLADCFLAGMLFRVGCPILASVAPDEYERALEESVGDEAHQIELERKIFGCSYAEAGAYQLAIWGFDPRIIEAILSQHDEIDDVASPVYTIGSAIRDARRSILSSVV